MLPILENKKEALIKLCEQYSIKSMYAFGSVTTDQFNAKSDIDILITFKELPFDQYTDNFFKLHIDLEKLLERKIDLLTERSLSNPYFIESIDQTKQLLYAAA